MTVDAVDWETVAAAAIGRVVAVAVVSAQVMAGVPAAVVMVVVAVVVRYKPKTRAKEDRATIQTPWTTQRWYY